MPHPDPTACRRMKTAIAAESGNIQGMSERFLSESQNYLVRRIPQGSYNTDGGEDQIVNVRYSTAPIEERQYMDILVNGEENGTMPARGCTGAEGDISTSMNVKGAPGNHLPGQTIHGGYDTFSQTLKGKAFETDTVSVMDILLKKHWRPYIEMLRRDLPKRAVEHFSFELQRLVIAHGKYNTAVLPGFTFNEGGFPAAPTGVLDLGTVRRIMTLIKAEGWEGTFEVTTSHDAFNAMRINYKNDYGLEMETTVVSPETHFLGMETKVVEWGGIRWILEDFPVRGYLRTNGDGETQFVPVRPTKARAGTGAGVVSEVNTDYFQSFVYCEGTRYPLYEVGFYVHPTAATRKGFAVPQMADKRYSKNMFNFEARMIDGPYIPCNEDNFFFYWRLLHAFGFQSLWPERMGAILYRVQPDPVKVNAAITDAPVDIAEVGMAPAQPVQHDECSYAEQTEDCADDLDAAFVPLPTEDDPVPTPEEGELRFLATALTTETDSGSLKVWVERVGGVLGAATVALDTDDGTAVNATDYTDASATLSWADGEAGAKALTVPILSGGAGGKAFTVKRTSPTGASWSGATSVTISIVA